MRGVATSSPGGAQVGGGQAMPAQLRLMGRSSALFAVDVKGTGWLALVGSAGRGFARGRGPGLLALPGEGL
ncbi:hypothetical protein ACFP90_01230 [Deinococcus multiflagellatus]|uniref:Uncharacterized protein n=2 Tax=Deinococcus multiflagellatus TaxID=1656887 RepID=A0ABW1ZFA4_9DEIO